MQFIKKLSVLTQFGRWIEAFGVSHRSDSLSYWILFRRQIKTFSSVIKYPSTETVIKKRLQTVWNWEKR